MSDRWERERFDQAVLDALTLLASEVESLLNLNVDVVSATEQVFWRFADLYPHSDIAKRLALVTTRPAPGGTMEDGK